MERSIIHHLLFVSEWGFLFDTMDLRMTIKWILGKQGITIHRFKDWCYSFLKRHKSHLKNHVCRNIFYAQLSHDTIEAYSAGWFDYICFVDWFCTVALPNCQKLPLEAKKILIGDNLSSDFPNEVLRECKCFNSIICMLTWVFSEICIWCLSHPITGWLRQPP